MVSSSAHSGSSSGSLIRSSSVQQRRLAREEPALGAEAVEQHRQVHGELVEQAEQVGAVGVARLAQRGAGQARVELEAFGLVPWAIDSISSPRASAMRRAHSRLRTVKACSRTMRSSVSLRPLLPRPAGAAAR